MQPQNTPQSVMDVTPHPTTLPNPAPAHTEDVSMATPPAEAISEEKSIEMSTSALAPKKQPKPAQSSDTPVALIVMTVLAMLILSGLAVMIYLSSQH